MQERMFEIAIRSKFRFPFKGSISVEDLWDLSVRDLDSIFKTLNAQLKQVTEESLLNTKSEADKALELKINIVRYVVAVKQREAQAALQAQERKEHKQKILEILASKKDAALQDKSVEELEAMLAETE